MNHLPYRKLCASRSLLKGYLAVISNMPMRHGHSTTANIKSINYEELVEHMKNKTNLVDVREKHELQETGTLPNSVHIPVGEVEKALQLPDSEFSSRFGSPKPRVDEELIFSCRSGRRSELAAEIALKLGFEKVINYSGGWLDWAEHQKQGN